MKVSAFYKFAILLFSLGCIWLIVGISNITQGQTLCPFRLVTGVPCPSCGSTTSAMLIIKGEFLNAFRTNALGYIVFSIMIVLPILLTIDFFLKKTLLFNLYQSVEKYFKRKPLVLFIFLFFVTVVWLVNIFK